MKIFTSCTRHTSESSWPCWIFLWRLAAAGAILQRGVNIYAPVLGTKAANSRVRMLPGQWWHVCCETKVVLRCSQMRSTWLSSTKTSWRGSQYSEGPYTFLRIRLLLTCLFPFALFGSHDLQSILPKKCFWKVKGQTVVIKGSAVTAGEIMWPQCQSQRADIL